MGIPVVFTDIMAVMVDGVVRSKFFKPVVKIFYQSGFVIIDIDAGGYMHGIYQAKPLLDAAFADDLFYLRRYIDIIPPVRGFKP